MKRILVTSLLLSSLGALAAMAPACTQPPINCTTGHGGFAARYTLKAGSKQGSGACDTLTGEIIGLEKYNPSQAGDHDRQDLTKAILAIQSTTLGDLAFAEQDAGLTVDWSKVDSLGDFSSVIPDSRDVCTVPSLSTAEVSAPVLGANPATDVKYEWSNVRVRVTTAYEGTEMAADLKFTQDGCSAEYTVLGLWPAVSCDDGNGKPDLSLCDPKANPDAGHATGSGINPDFQPYVICDPVLLLCVLKEPPDDLK